MSNQTIKTLVDRVIDKHHGKPVTHARMADDIAKALRDYGNKAYEKGVQEGMKVNMKYDGQ